MVNTNAVYANAFPCSEPKFHEIDPWKSKMFIIFVLQHKFRYSNWNQEENGEGIKALRLQRRDQAKIDPPEQASAATDHGLRLPKSASCRKPRDP